MKGLTVWQPWASLIAAGMKPYEFRGVTSTRWMKPAIGQRIAIQAGARKVREKEVHALLVGLKGTLGARKPALAAEAELFLETMPIPNYPLSCILCTAVVGKPIHGAECARRLGMEVNDSDRPYTFNWGWPLTDIKPAAFIPCRGWQGLWNVPESIVREIT